MRTWVAVVVVAVLLSCSASFGAVITIGNAFANPGQTGYMPVTASAVGGFRGVSVFVGWYENAPLDFQYAPGFLANVGPVGGVATPVGYDQGAGTEALGVFTHDVSFGGWKANGIATTSDPVLIGYVVTRLIGKVGRFRVYVDGADSGFDETLDAGNVVDSSGCFDNTLPEPATLSLLALGGLLIARRRRATSALPVVLAVALLAGSANLASADVFHMGGTRDTTTGQWTGTASLEFVTVGDPRNAPDSATGNGAVPYTFQMGKYDVTVGQYCAFLNAVAKSDPFGLYSSDMSPATFVRYNSGATPCGITQTGTSQHGYDITGNPNNPMTCITWGAAARFCNWLANGQPTGNEGPGTTETGSYTLNGATSTTGLMAITRNTGAAYVIPAVSEWYKAAYYKGGSASAGYWAYATRSNTAPSNVFDPAGTNNANYYYNGTYSDPVNYMTPVGAFAGSPGPYGTFDQDGDFFQWTEGIATSTARDVRGGCYYVSSIFMDVHHSSNCDPANDGLALGLRVALVPEPATLSLLALGGLLLARRRAARVLPILLAGCLLLGSAGVASADVFNMGGTRDPATGQWTGSASVEFVTVGDLGNIADVSYDYRPRHGAVAYAYQIGKYDVTAGQYCQFLNAAATASDPYGLYNTNMSTDAAGCGISRTGSPGAYVYSVTKNGNFPVNWVNWGDAARFCNWLYNGQPTGPQGPGTTETGSYSLAGTHALYNADGSVKDFDGLDRALMGIGRSVGATYVLPTLDEWYKAAYFKGGSTNAGYWMYPTRSDRAPSNVLSSAGTNNANYYDWNGYTGYTDPVNYLTVVGAFAASSGPYGTFDMGGDVQQWNEAVYPNSGSYRGLQGGAFNGMGTTYNYDTLKASAGGADYPTSEEDYEGFRVALVPEPATLSLLALGGLLLARRRVVRVRPILLAGCLLLGSAGLASADVFNMGGTRNPATGQWAGLASLEFATVGDPANAPDVDYGDGPRGAVAYTYQMSRYDTTAVQYCQFLNAVATTDTYGLYSPYMAYISNTYGGCGIVQKGTSGSYTYSVTASRENFPVNFVSWGDAARFCNWLSNGQPIGAQGAHTTETGSYTLNGAISQPTLMSITRNSAATYVIPNQDEWYKAAYYKGGSATAGYWMFPTQSNDWPSNVLDPAGTNNANYMGGTGYANPANLLTTVGYFASSPGPRGTFDMGGDVEQWDETNHAGWARDARGGSFNFSGTCLRADYYWGYGNPLNESELTGFRVALVPEPATLALLALGGLLITRRRRG